MSQPPDRTQVNARAHELLASIYDWFTEGRDSKDLKEAKALLGKLRSHSQTC